MQLRVQFGHIPVNPAAPVAPVCPVRPASERYMRQYTSSASRLKGHFVLAGENLEFMQVIVLQRQHAGCYDAANRDPSRGLCWQEHAIEVQDTDLSLQCHLTCR